MGSVLAHLSLIPIYLLFPNLLDLSAWVIGLMLPDIEYLFIIGKDILKKTKKEQLTLNAFTTGILHSFIGLYLVALPLTVGALYYFYMAIGVKVSLIKIIFSLFLGFSVHLLLDLPAHPYLMLFYPIKIRNPFLINLNWKFIKRIYPYRKIEHQPYFYLREFNWLILSTILSILLLILLMI